MLGLLPLLLIACGDDGVKIINDPPAASITWPSDGDTLAEGRTVELQGVAADPNDGPDELLASWRVDGVEICPAAAPDSEGEIRCEYTPDGTGTAKIGLIVTDPLDAISTDEVQIEIAATQPPVAEITSPADGAELTEDELVTFAGVVSDLEDGPDDLVVTWESSEDGALGLDLTVDSDGSVQGTGRLSQGTHVLTMKVLDQDGKSDSDSVEVTVGPANGAPDCEILFPLEDEVVSLLAGVDLIGQVADDEQSADSLDVSWESDADGPLGSSIPASDGTVELSTDLSLGSHIVTMTVTDDGGLTCRDNVSIEVAAGPGIELVSPGSGALFQEDERISIEASVTDTEDAPDALTVTLQSDLDGSLGSASPDSDGDVSFSPDLSTGSHVLTLTATDTDGLTGTERFTLIVNGAPSAPVVSLSPSAPTTGDALSVDIDTAAVDPEGDSPTYRYAWTRDGDSTSYTGTSVAASATAKTERWTVQVVALDGDGGESDPATASVTIVNSAPELRSVAVTPDDPDTNDTVTCDADATDADDDDIDLSYRWEVDGSTVSVTSATLSGSWFSRGEEIRCGVVADDGDDESAETWSDPVEVVNTPPTLDSLSLTPSDPTVDDTLRANTSTSDADGDTVTVTYAWYVEGDLVAEGASATLSGEFVKGDTVEVVVTTEDDSDEGSGGEASAVVENSPPGAPVVEVTPEDPYAYEDMLTCTVTADSSDADGDSVEYSYAWWVDGASSGRTGRTVAGSFTAPGEDWECRVTPDDGEDSGTVGRASVVVLGDPVDYAHIQYPCSATLAPGETLDVYGWVYELGITDSSGEGDGISGQVGVGAWGDDPSVDDSGWDWFDAAYFADKDGLSSDDNDEYKGTLTAPDAEGDYAYVFRFSTDAGASWIYADLGPESGCGGLGTTDGFDIDDAAPLTVVD